jgi:uncharacterized protein
MAKHAGKENAMHLERVWQSVVAQLGQSEEGSLSKFKFKGVVPGVSHYSRLAGAIDWLSAIGLVHKIQIAHRARVPLAGYTKENQFKLALFDVGILGAMAGLTPKVILDSDYGSYKGFFAESFVAQELTCSGRKNLYCWREEDYEIDFLLQFDENLVPVEVKSGRSVKSKSRSFFCQEYDPPYTVTLSAKPIFADHQRTSYYLPLYPAGRIPLIRGPEQPPAQ